MALVVKDRVKETTTSTGTGTITLAGPSTGFQSFSVIGNGNTTYYTIVDPVTGAWEVGIGTYTASGTTLSRDTVLESSNSNNLVNFAAGSKDVFVTYPAERSAYTEVGQVVTISSPPSAGTWLPTDAYYSKATYPALAAKLGNQPDFRGGLFGRTKTNIMDSVGATTFEALVQSGTDTNTYLFVTAAYFVATFDGGDNWETIATPATANISDFRWLNGQFVAITSSSNQILYSTTGYDWQQIVGAFPVTGNNRIQYGAGRYVVNTSSGVAYSTNLIDWTAVSLANSITTLTWVPGLSRFVATGANMAAYYSSDGVTWTLATSSAGLGSVNWIAYGASGFVAIGSTSSRYMTSADGITWSAVQTLPTFTTATPSVVSYISALNLYIITGNNTCIWTSPDAVTWTLRVSADINDYNYGSTCGRAAYSSATGLVYVGANTSGGGSWLYFTSPDGVTWTPRAPDFNNGLFTLATIGAHVFGIGGGITKLSLGTPLSIVTGDAYSVTGASSLNVAPSPTYFATDGTNVMFGGFGGPWFTSDGGVNWVRKVVPISNAVYQRGAYYLNGKWILTTDSNAIKVTPGTAGVTGGVIWSSDMNTWTASPIRNDCITKVFYGAGLYIATTSSTSTAASIYTSPDLITWTARTAGAATPLDGAYGAGLFVLVGTGGLQTSPDGVTWTGRTVSTNLTSIAYNGSQFITVNTTGFIYSSPDGVTWSSRTSGVSTNLKKVIWNGSLFVIVGSASTILTSPDGITWTNRTPADTTAPLNAVAWNGTCFIATAWTNYNGFWRSTDGITWVKVANNQPGSNGLCVQALNGAFYAVGNTPVQVSTDGVNWLSAKYTQRTIAGGGGVAHYKFGDNYYIMTGIGGLRRSTDGGRNFSNIFSIMHSTNPTVMAYGNGITLVLFQVGAGAPPTIYRSTDEGATWSRAADFGNTTASSTTYQGFVSMTFSNGYFFLYNNGVNAALGINNTIYRSPDGVTWTGMSTISVAGNRVSTDGTKTVIPLSSSINISENGYTPLGQLLNSSLSILYDKGVWAYGQFVGKSLDTMRIINLGTYPPTNYPNTQAMGVYGDWAVFYPGTSQPWVRFVVNAKTGASRMVKPNGVDFFSSTTRSGSLVWGLRTSDAMFFIPTNSTAATTPTGFTVWPVFSYDTTTTFYVPPPSQDTSLPSYICASPM